MPKCPDLFTAEVNKGRYNTTNIIGDKKDYSMDKNTNIRTSSEYGSNFYAVTFGGKEARPGK